MKRKKQLASHLRVSPRELVWAARLRAIGTKGTPISKGAPAYTLFYIQDGGVRLSTKTKHQPAADTAILEVGDLFGDYAWQATAAHAV
jgi:hypothetical protein